MKTLVVHRERLRHNLRIIREVIGQTQLIAVVKANGYGLGAVQYVRALTDMGVSQFAVSRLEEAIQLREAGITRDILLLSSTGLEEDVVDILHFNLIASVSSYESALLLNGIAQREEKIVRVHIKVDTGFGRQGFMPDETDKIVKIAQFMPNLKIEGIFSHLSDAFGKDGTFTKVQYENFTGVLTLLREAKVEYGSAHIANSCAALRYPYTRMDCVRIGSALLGRLPVKNTWGLQRVGHLAAEILDTHWLPKGHNVGYANTYTTSRATRVAVIQLGYADGYGVEKSRDTFRPRDIFRYLLADFKKFFRDNRFYCEIGGKKVPVLGRVSLTNIVVDVTDIQCEPGEVATFDINPLLVDSAVERIYV